METRIGLYCAIFSLLTLSRSSKGDLLWPSIEVSEDKDRYVKGGEFFMGVNDPTSKTGEYPPKKVAVRPFIIDKYPVSVKEFEAFKEQKRLYKTGAEEVGYSWVFFSQMSKFAEFDRQVRHPRGDSAWFAVKGATWEKPFGFERMAHQMPRYPVTHVTWYDAHAFCIAKGKRLPTEFEWEYAARGGKEGLRYPWGDQFKRNRMNVWQGTYPQEDHAHDGWNGISPIDAYQAQNDYGLFDMVGNTWEWTSTKYTLKTADLLHKDPDVPKEYVVKGGSFVDSRDGSINIEARNSARLGYPPNYSSGNVGFRCVEHVPYVKPDPKPQQGPKLFPVTIVEITKEMLQAIKTYILPARTAKEKEEL